MLISKTINSALRKIGVLTAQDEAQPADLQLGLETLNRIVDAYNTESLIVTHLQDIAISMPLGGWGNTVTIGNSLDVDMVAPSHIENLFWRQDTTDFKSVVMSYDQWANITTKSNTKIPRRHFIQNIDNNNKKIYFDAIPQESLELHLQAKLPYTGVNSNGNDYLVTDDINWTFGFEKMLMYRLAVELGPDFEVIPSQIVIGIATESEAKVKAYNYQPLTLKSDVSLSKSVLFGRRNNRGY